jgi:outer membrane protein TolC
MLARTSIAVCLVLLFTGTTYSLADDSKPAGENTKIKELQKERLAALKDVARLAMEGLRVGQGTPEEVGVAQRMLLDAELDLCSSDKERVEVLEKYLTQSQDIEKMMDKLVKSGILGPKSALIAKADRLQVEIALARAKEKIDGRK